MSRPNKTATLLKLKKWMEGATLRFSSGHISWEGNGGEAFLAVDGAGRLRLYFHPREVYQHCSDGSESLAELFPGVFRFPVLQVSNKEMRSVFGDKLDSWRIGQWAHFRLICKVVPENPMGRLLNRLVCGMKGY